MTLHPNTSIHCLKALHVLDNLINKRFQVLSNTFQDKASNEKQLLVQHACSVMNDKRWGLLLILIYSKNTPGCSLQLIAEIRFHCCEEVRKRQSPIWEKSSLSFLPSLFFWQQWKYDIAERCIRDLEQFNQFEIFCLSMVLGVAIQDTENVLWKKRAVFNMASVAHKQRIHDWWASFQTSVICVSLPAYARAIYCPERRLIHS